VAKQSRAALRPSRNAARNGSDAQLLPSRLTIRHLPADSLRLDPLNPRVHSEKQIQQIANSIRSFGFNVPILVDHEGNVLAGHGRLLASKLLGMTEVPTICLDHLSPYQLRAFMLADNKLSLNSAWNEVLLGEQLKALSEVELDFDLEATGFEMAEIDLLIEGSAPSANSAQDPADAIPELGFRVSKSGDLWRLGEHRLLCDDALDPESYTRLMGDQLASVIFADPPFNVPIEGHASGLGKKQHGDFLMACGEMSTAEFTDFLCSVCNHMARFSRDGSIHFICMDWRHVGELVDAGRDVYSELKNICVWVKDNGGMGSFYRSQHEFVFVFKRGNSSHRNNIRLGQFGRYRTNVWRYPGANSFSRSTKEGNLLALHPTVKSAALVADAIMDCSARGDIVLDPFVGSGTTVIAAERTGRICYGIDLDPLYVDTTVRRWQAFTGLSAAHAFSGRSFADLEQEAGNEPER
jgi:DNA modification methylase